VTIKSLGALLLAESPFESLHLMFVHRVNLSPFLSCLRPPEIMLEIPQVLSAVIGSLGSVKKP
jgi:hypothetical protein